MTASLMPNARQQYFNTATNTPMENGYVYTYAAGTTTPKATYTTAAANVQNANPVRLDARGEATMFWSGSYFIDVRDANNVSVYTQDNYTDPQSVVDTIRSDLAASTGATLMGWINSFAGSVARTVSAKLRDSAGPKDAGAVGDGVANDYTALQALATHGDTELRAGSYLTNSALSFTQPVSMVGRGPKSVVAIGASFPLGSDLFTVSPAAGTEKRNWEFTDFQVTNAGTNARNTFLLDIAAAGKFLNKLRIKGVVSDQTTGYFVELLNSIPNVDGLFTSVFEDNWSLNGYYLDNVGDSVILQRNTTSGTGRGYYVNQLPGASHIIIRDGNCTSPGGILVAHSFNMLFDNMQCEITGTYTGTGTGMFTVQNGAVGAVNQNLRITNNNFNANGATNTTLACVYVNDADATVIEGNTLFCNSATGAHIVVGPTATNTYIGKNKYYNQSGAEIAPIITNTGTGTVIRPIDLIGSAVYDPPSLVTGGVTSAVVTVLGAKLGDVATCSFSLDTQGILLSSYVSSADQVTVFLVNRNAGTIDLASGTLKCVVTRS